MAKITEMPTPPQTPELKSQPDALQALAGAIVGFRGKYPKSLSLKTDLEAFLDVIEGLYLDLAEKEATRIEQDAERVKTLGEIEQCLEIAEAQPQPFDERLQAVLATLQGNNATETKNLADSCYRLVNDHILTEPDIGLRPAIEALCYSLANFDSFSENFFETARIKIKIRA